MLITKSGVVKDIGAYKIARKFFGYTVGEGLKNRKLIVNSLLLNVEGVSGFYFFNSFVIVTRWGSDDSEIFRIEDGAPVHEFQGLKIQGIIGEFLILIDKNRIYHYYDFSLNILFRSQTLYSVIYSSMAIACDKTEVKKNNLNDEVIWQFSVKDLGPIADEPTKTDSIETILGIAQTNFWFYAVGGRLVALSLETGMIKAVFTGRAKDRFEGSIATLGLGRCFIRETDKFIVSLSSFSLQLFDIFKIQMIEAYNFSEVDPHGIGKYVRIYSPLLQGDFFTFLGEKAGDLGGIRHVGVFDYKLRKLIWEYEVISQNDCSKYRNQLVVPNPLYIGEDKLYIKDILNNLHIFEKAV
ncbi:MAG: hypothetical protein IPH24_12700 [Crocinitomicaceae bacterium]|nr:hypothetical protein [Crocinitomicaceae bacterium]